MRVHVLSTDPAATATLTDALVAAGHTVTSSALAQVAIVAGSGPDLAERVRQAHTHELRPVLLVVDDIAAAVPDGVTDLAIAPLREGELAARLAVIEHRLSHGTAKRLELLAWAVESAGDIIEITSPEPRFEYVNPAFTRTLGFAADDVVGKSPAEVIRSEIHQEGYFEGIDETLSSGRSWKGLLISRALDDRLVYLESTIAPVMDADGTCTHHVAVKRDITARLQADNELRRKSAELEQARDAALEASRSKSQFLANMSHELRTPLNAIIGYSEMLAEDAEDAGEDALLQDLGRIKSSGEHLLELINDVLDLSKIEAGAMRLHLESFDLRTAIHNVVATVQPLMKTQGNTLALEIPDGIGIMRADLTKVRQTLLNLLSNAAKFTHDATVTLRVIDDTDQQGTRCIRFEIQDEGIGIDTETQQRLFRAFVQADASTTRKYGGTGLGLAISQRFCAMMGGQIVVASTPGVGSTFTVTLPRVVPEPETTPAQGTPALRRRREGHRVLVVDDDPAMRDLLERALSRHGFSVETATDGRSGLEHVRKDPPAAVVLDVMMPELDGWGMLTELKGDPATADIPVVMLTILEKSDVGFALGAVDFLIKPVQTQRLAAVLHRHCRSDCARVLVIEDDGASRERMRRTLTGAGHVVREAANGREGIEALDSDPPDLVLLDLMMPEVDGFAVLEHMRATDSLVNVPVVVITAKDLTPSERAMLSSAQTIVERNAYAGDELLDDVALQVASLVGE